MATPGLDLPALTQWLDRHLPGLRTDRLTADLITGGRSNLTYRITDGCESWALRRPPLAHVLDTAHDMAREYAVLKALDSTDVPAAAPVALCEDPEVLGSPFYLMRFVEGITLEAPEQVRALSSQEAERVCVDMVDTLVRLHALDPDDVGLGGWRRDEEFLARQLRRWRRQWDASATVPRPEVDALFAALERRRPERRSEGLVHGDFRLSNLLVDRAARVVAVLDWEMATVGDPLTDLGLLMAYQRLSFDGLLVDPHLPKDAGFLAPEELAERYAARARRDVTDLAWYLAFAHLKLAVIAEGIHHRHQLAQTVGDGFDRFGPAVPGLIDAALEHL